MLPRIIILVSLLAATNAYTWQQTVRSYEPVVRKAQAYDQVMTVAVAISPQRIK